MIDRCTARALAFAICTLLLAAATPAFAGKCCTPDGRCLTRTPEQCAAIDGAVYEESPTGCSSIGDSCTAADPVGACCTGGLCTVTTQASCNIAGVFVGGTCGSQCAVFGACCQNTGGCVTSTESQCFTTGTWDGGSCATAPCPSAGVCCQGTACSAVLSNACTGGTFFSGGSCSASPCSAQQGRCCTEDGRCFVNSLAQCDNLEGAWVAGVTCATDCEDAQVLGACCIANSGGCTYGQNTDCPSPNEFRPASTCATANVCTLPPIGACCENFACRITVAPDCSGGTYFASGGCSPSPCGTPPDGACCTGASCTIALQTACINGGGEWYTGQACTTELCRLGSCCLAPRQCVVTTQPGCEQGAWAADGTCIGDFYCISETGSCCRTSGQCVVTSAGDCTNGTYAAFGACSTPACTIATGSCCAGTACTIGTSTDCDNAGGTYQGDNSVCGTAANPTTCCRANFNGTDGVGVQDIFDFLNAWFAGDPHADLDGNGLSVQDIFDYLNLWFIGC